MHKLYEILLPLKTNAGAATDVARTHFLADCRALAKGYSVLPMIAGSWENDKGEVFFDRSIPVRVAAEENTWAKLVRLAHKHFPDQECLLSYCVSDAPEFSFPSETDKLYGELKGVAESAAKGVEQPARVAGFDVDLQTFNYGRALGAPKDGNAAKQYQHVTDYARCLASIATQFSRAAWKLDMALQNVRKCQTEDEQGAALFNAVEAFVATDVAMESVTGSSGDMRVKFHRYGRAFRSAKAI